MSKSQKPVQTKAKATVKKAGQEKFGLNLTTSLLYSRASRQLYGSVLQGKGVHVEK